MRVLFISRGVRWLRILHYIFLSRTNPLQNITSAQEYHAQLNTSRGNMVGKYDIKLRALLKRDIDLRKKKKMIEGTQCTLSKWSVVREHNELIREGIPYQKLDLYQTHRTLHPVRAYNCHASGREKLITILLYFITPIRG